MDDLERKLSQRVFAKRLRSLRKLQRIYPKPRNAGRTNSRLVVIVTSYIFQHWTNKAKTGFGRDSQGNNRFALEEPSFLSHWAPKCTPAKIDPERQVKLKAIVKAQVKGLAFAKKTATIEECLTRPTMEVVRLPKSYKAEAQSTRVFTLTSHDDRPPCGFWIYNGEPRLIEGHCMSVLPKSDDTIWRFPTMQTAKVTLDIANQEEPLYEKTYSRKSGFLPTWEPCIKGWEQANELFESVIKGQDITINIPPELMKASLVKPEHEVYFYKQKITVMNRETGETLMELQAPELPEDTCVAFHTKTLFRSKANRIVQHRPYSERHTSIKACRIEHKNGEYGVIMPVLWSEHMLKTYGLIQGA